MNRLAMMPGNNRPGSTMPGNSLAPGASLAAFFRPRSIAVIGASDRPGSVGAKVWRNVLDGGFTGSVWPVNPRHAQVRHRRAYASAAQLPEAPELAVVCTPASTVPEVVAQLGARGTRAALILSAGVDDTAAPGGVGLRAGLLEAARAHGVRILGPNSVGLLVPGIGLNASFAHAPARPGQLAFISQSGALTTALLDWALDHRHIGFSHFISLGNAADVDFADLLDYLGTDHATRAILLYVESVSAARRFMSAARATARAKPVIAVKAGRAPEAAKAAASHTGALAGADDVYEAAFQRAGMLRVSSTRELFDAAETLASVARLPGERLAIMSNGGGPAVMATDALMAGGGRLATLAPATLAALDACLPGTWSHANPIDLIGDAPVARYVDAIAALAADPGIDALLFIHAPTAIARASEIARACAPLLARFGRPVLCCWMGGSRLSEARAICDGAGLATFSMPEEAVSAFLHLERYRHNQLQLLEAPPALGEEFLPDTAAARALIARVLTEGRTVLSEPEAKSVLAAYGIPVVETRIARTCEELPGIAAALGFPLALKILSPDLSHKSDVGGVALEIASLEELMAAARSMLARCRERAPQARLAGFTVQRMVRRGGAYELIVGLATDATFGPVVLFGEGGTAAELIADRAIALPPLNVKLARELIARTRIARLLKGFRERPGIDADGLERVLIRVAQLAAELAEVAELDINPLLASAQGVVALDARIRVAPASGAGADRFAIRPYPKELEEFRAFEGQRILLRPIRPEDHDQHAAFLARIAPDDMRARFFHAVRALSDAELARLTQLDYEREMAFIAVAADDAGVPQTLAVARASSDAANVTAEFAVLVRSDLKGRGLGAMLLEKLIEYAAARGTRRLAGEVLADNRRMLHLAQALGFECTQAGGGVIAVSLELERIRSHAALPAHPAGGAGRAG